MATRKVERPVPGREAFQRTGAAAVQSQAALLLLLGRQMRGDDQALLARAAATEREGFVEPVPEHDLREFEVPRLRATGERLGVRRIGTLLAENFGSDIPAARAGAAKSKGLRRPLTQLAEQLYADPDPLIAAQLMEACLRHPEELTRVAAAASYFELSSEPKRLIKILADGARSWRTQRRRTGAGQRGGGSRADFARSRALTVVDEGPSRPLGPRAITHQSYGARHLRKKRRMVATRQRFPRIHSQHGSPDLFSAADRFDWSGGYSDAARALAATELANWVDARGLAGLDILAHSHGANVAMLASQSGLTVGTLVLLSCPVHIHKYSPNSSAITRVVSLRVHLVYKNKIGTTGARTGPGLLV